MALIVRGHARRVIVAVVLIGTAVLVGWRWLTRFPPDTAPEGAYLRIALSIEQGAPEAAFPYLQEEAQVACYTIRDYARRCAGAIASDYPAAERDRELPRYQRLAGAADPPQIWARIAEDRGWIGRLRKDLSGVAAVERAGDRATVVTARGARYAFRRRPNGSWGLSAFTAQLDAEARRLARDWDVIRKAASDYRADEKVP